jgi:hypothetical protein
MRLAEKLDWKGLSLSLFFSSCTAGSPDTCQSFTRASRLSLMSNAKADAGPDGHAVYGVGLRALA